MKLIFLHQQTESIFTRSNALGTRLPGETDRNLNMRLTEHKQGTRNGDASNRIVVHHQLTNCRIDWNSAQCLTYSTTVSIIKD